MSWLRPKQALLASALLLLCAAPLAAQAPADTHARVELIAEQATASAGRTFWVGVLFRLDPGWHVYWQNPGDSGEPPRIEWHLPPGFVAGAVRWPQPIRLGTGSVVDYGYEAQVLLMAPVEGASRMPINAAPGVSADVRYIVCREMCIPGKAHLALAPPPGGDWAGWHALFESTRQQLPKLAPAGWKVSAESDKSQFIVSVRSAGHVQSGTFFPLEPNQIDNSSAQGFASEKDGFRLTLKQSDQLLKPVTTLRGLIVLGPGRAFEVAAPVASR